jgi:putative phage-type endonuclease
MALTVEQLRERTKYLGGSDAAAVLGLSRWKTPLEVWAEKTGMLEPEDISAKLHIRVGNALEGLVCQLFEEESGLKVNRNPPTVFHPSFNFLAANLDGIINPQTIVEFKTANGFKGKEWANNEIPVEYQVQAMHSLAVTGASKCYVACLIGGNQDFVIRCLGRNEKLIEQIVSREVAFWRGFVEPKIQPTIITPDDGEVLYKLFPNAKEEEIPLTDAANRLAESIQSLKQDKKHLEATIKREENTLKAMLQDKAVGSTGTWRVAWREQKQDRIDSEKLRAMFPEIASQVLKETKFRKLDLSKIQTEQGEN